MALPWISGPNMTVPDWSGPAVSVAAVAVGAVLVGALPTRLLAPVATVLAGIGLLVFFYVGLAVIANVASGTAPITPTIELGATPAPDRVGPCGTSDFAGDRVRGLRDPYDRQRQAWLLWPGRSDSRWRLSRCAPR